jgi:hypothetical protein
MAAMFANQLREEYVKLGQQYHHEAVGLEHESLKRSKV